MAHAKLSPSAASRWMACTPSASLEATMPDIASGFAEEGTLAHSIGELMIRHAVGEISKADYSTRLKEYQQHALYQDEMLTHCDTYATYIVELFNEARSQTSDAVLLLERKLDMSAYVPEGFGTGDAVIIADHTLHFGDLKYGKGVPVSAQENKQLKLYGLGALEEFDHLYDVREVCLHIIQPRLDSISSFTISAEDLRAWGRDVVKPLATKAFNGEGEFAPGDHCRFCKVKPVCKALATYSLELARHEFQDPAVLGDDDISDVLNRADMFTNWLNSVEAYALDQAVNHGKKWPGYKVVEGRSNRVYSDSDKVAKLLMDKGFSEEIIYTKKLNGITALEKEVGKKEFNALLGQLIIKPAGKPTLVPESDKRPDYSSAQGAAADFAQALSEINQ